MSILSTAYCSQKLKLPLNSLFWQTFCWTDQTQTQGLRPGKKVRGNWQKQFLVSNTNLRYCLTSEQILAHQGSWYTENRAITLVHRLPQHGTTHGHFARNGEQTLLWLNQRMKTSLLPTCWGVLVAPSAMDGLGCIGKLITNFIGLMTALRREIIRTGTMASQTTVEATRIVLILQEATLMEHGMTYLA